MSKYNSVKEVNANLPEHIEFPMDYFPKGIGPGSFDPQLMYIHALACQRAALHDVEIKSWVVLWLLDHVDWESVVPKHRHTLPEHYLGQ